MTSDLDGATVRPEPNVYAATPGEFAATWNEATEERRQEWLDRSRESSETAMRCWMMQHDAQLQWAESRLAAVREAIAETDTMTLNPGARRALDNVRMALA